MPKPILVECRDRDGKKIRINLGGARAYEPGPREAHVEFDEISPAWRKVIELGPLDVLSIHRTTRGRWVVVGKFEGRPRDFRFVANGDEVNGFLFRWDYLPVRLSGMPRRLIVNIGNHYLYKHVTEDQFRVVKALIQAGEAGLDQAELESYAPDARGMLGRLMRDRDWSAVIRMAGGKTGRYRFAHVE